MGVTIGAMLEEIQGLYKQHHQPCFLYLSSEVIKVCRYHQKFQLEVAFRHVNGSIIFKTVFNVCIQTPGWCKIWCHPSPTKTPKWCNFLVLMFTTPFYNIMGRLLLRPSSVYASKHQNGVKLGVIHLQPGHPNGVIFCFYTIHYTICPFYNRTGLTLFIIMNIRKAFLSSIKYLL